MSATSQGSLLHTRISGHLPAGEVFVSSRKAKGPLAKSLLEGSDTIVRLAYCDWAYCHKDMSATDRLTLNGLYGSLIRLRNELKENTVTWKGSCKAIPDLWSLRKLARKFYTSAQRSRESMYDRIIESPRPSGSSDSSSSSSSVEVLSPNSDSSLDTMPERQLKLYETLWNENIMDWLRQNIQGEAETKLSLAIIDTARSAGIDDTKFRLGVKSLLLRKDLVKSLLDMPDVIIEIALDMLQRASNDCRATEGLSATECEKILRRVSYKAGLLPPCMYVTDLKVRLSMEFVNGGHGSVFRGELGGTKVAVKIIYGNDSDNDEEKRQGLKTFHREAMLWQQLQHPNILPLIGICEKFDGLSPNKPGMISAWCQHGNLRNYLKAKTRNNEVVDRISLLARIADALCYLHNHKYQLVHKDLRLANVVVDDGFEPRLTDFGISTIANSTTVSHERAHIGTTRWMAPEIFEDESVLYKEMRARVTPAIDMYAFACLCLEMYTLLDPWSEIGPMDNAVVKKRVRNGERPSRPPGNVIPEQVWSLVEKCWPQDPQQRMTSDDARQALQAMLTT
ncbi:kinase-like protein [Neolentinus lepideus HHB14362 ss-1]|uniref:Kinase-like protein n=1 Tax=Neolentinus lepideus HHB14362 ss-1 TaxID=1314782 RepID=A0A165V3Y9_9AGAM|nr:kinase-like protein [Neolentinus lepideus HHB14362 ss-1]